MQRFLAIAASGSTPTSAASSTTSNTSIVSAFHSSRPATSATVIKQHVWGLTYIDELVETEVDGTDYYALLDSKYCVLALLEADGDIAERYEFTPDGRRHVFVSAGGNDLKALTPLSQSPRAGTAKAYSLCDFGFQGLCHDEVTGNIYQRAREYSPRLARFMQRDPLGYPDGMNSYAAYHVLSSALDPWGTYEIQWKGDWTFAEREIIRDSLNRIKSRAQTLIRQIERLERRHGNDICTRAGIIELKTRLQDIIDGIDGDQDLELRHESLGDSEDDKDTQAEASHVHDWHDVQITFNDNVTNGDTWDSVGDNELDRILLHELSHVEEPGGDMDDTLVPFDPHVIDDMITTDVEKCASVRYHISEARRDSNHDAESYPRNSGKKPSGGYAGVWDMILILLMIWSAFWRRPEFVRGKL